MDYGFLFKTEKAEGLYREFAEALPIIDFHNHLSVDELAEDKKFDDICDLWLTPDPYKHRLMRICGVEEKFITGDAPPRAKFNRFCEVFPRLAGSPLYDWSRAELEDILGIALLPSRETADRIFDEAAEKLAGRDYSMRSVLGRFHIEYQSPIASPLDSLSSFKKAGIAPSLRGDALLCPDKELTAALEAKLGKKIANTADYIAAVGTIIDGFAAAGCKFADHALDTSFDYGGKEAELLTLLAAEYAKRGFTLLLHLDAKRQTSPRLRALAGPAGGYAAVGGGLDCSGLCDMLGRMESRGGLPKTLLFPLNMADQAALAVLQGSFSEDGVPSKVGLGPAWWWCDHEMGIRNTLECVASFGVLSEFVGMTTDSRSVLSFARHGYFRRILCSFVDETLGARGVSRSVMGEIIEKISYKNAKRLISGGKI